MDVGDRAGDGRNEGRVNEKQKETWQDIEKSSGMDSNH